MTERELTIWAAGFFDGEGCISIGKAYSQPRAKKHYVAYQLAVIIAQRDRRPMDALCSLFGGHIHPVAIHGSVYWYFRRHGSKAVRFLEAVRPFLQLKKDQAELALAFYKEQTSSSPNRRRNPSGQLIGRSVDEKRRLEEFYLKSKSINKRLKHADWTSDRSSSSVVQ